MFKCCYNCMNGLQCASTYPTQEIFNLTKRFCCASRPVSNHGVDAFKKRSCKQFEPYDEDYAKFYKPLSEKEAVEMSIINAEKANLLRKQHNII